MKAIRVLFFVLVAVALLGTAAAPLMAQTGATGALAGTVTDPSGAVISGATVTATSIGTGAERTATTTTDGAYKIPLLPPGKYSVKFSASGFKTTEVASVTVNVTETSTLNRSLEIGEQAVRVTVEAARETIQTENVTNGVVVSADVIKALPLVSRNYTQILSLSPGVVTNVANASAVGNGTQDVSANGARGNQNNYSMDGASVTPYTSGNAAQVGSFPGIPIPNAEAIQEFKVQTSQYDAGFGRNAGVNVLVITRSGTNSFHGDAWEFNRNNFFNANDFFYKRSESDSGLPNKPQILKQNTFGGDLGGPIIKDKLFFFGSYQGFRQINGMGTTGFANGYQSAVTLMPWNDYADFASGVCADLRCTDNIPAYRAYLGSVFGPQPGEPACAPFASSFGQINSNCNLGWNDGRLVAYDGSNISNTAIKVLQAPGILNNIYNQGYYVPAALGGCTPDGVYPATYPNPVFPFDPPFLPHPLADQPIPSSGCTAAISLPTHANEDQFLANMDWVVSPKHTLTERYLYQRDPQLQSFLCLGSCNPGSPGDVKYTSHTSTMKLTSILRSNLVNEARITFYRNVADNRNANTLQACELPNGGQVIPLVNGGDPCPAVAVPPQDSEFLVIPDIGVFGFYSPSRAWNQGGNFASIALNATNTFQVGDQVSWNHGKHSVRVGFDGEWVQHNNSSTAAGKGSMSFGNVADFLTSSTGPLGADPSDPTYDDFAPRTVPLGLIPACGFFFTANCNGGAGAPFALRGDQIHYNRANGFDWFVQDDIKVTRKLTVNVGVRWEYGGWPSDKLGRFTNVWARQLALVNSGSYFLNDATLPLCAIPGAPIDPFPVGTLAGYIVPSNYDTAAGFTGPCGSTGVLVNRENTLLSGTPLHGFAPRFGAAWQPLGNKFVVRAGYGWFRDRTYTTFLIDGQRNLPPYADTATGTTFSNTQNTLHSPFQSVAGIPMTWRPRYLYIQSGGSVNGMGSGDQVIGSGLGYTSNSDDMSRQLPLTQVYSLNLQYDLGHNWIADVGYVGSHATHLFNAGANINMPHLVDCGAPSATCNPPTLPQDRAVVVNSAQPLQLPGTTIVQPYIPYNDPANTAPVLYNTTRNSAARVSYLGFSTTAPGTSRMQGDNKYNSLQAQIRHTFSKGLYLQASYTWSKALTDVNAASSSFSLEPGQVLFGNSASNNPLDFAQQYGLAAFNRSQRLIVSYSYDLPWKSMEGVRGKVLGGWSISGVTTLQNGQPFTVTDSGGGSIYGLGFFGGSRALLADDYRGECGANGVCQPSQSVGMPGSTKARVLDGLADGPGWINPDAFTTFSSIPSTDPHCIGGIQNFGYPGNPFLPPPYTDPIAPDPAATCGAAPSAGFFPFSPPSGGAPFWGAGTGWGDSPVGIITGPGQWNWDISIQKNTKVTEWGTLQFRAEFYNIWNHAQFGNPGNGVVGFGTFVLGRISSTSVTPRIVQFGLKFSF